MRPVDGLACELVLSFPALPADCVPHKPLTCMNETPLVPMSWRDRIGMVAMLCLVVAILFYQSFKPELVLFSSDGPLGILAAKDFALPGSFCGIWIDSNWLGASLGVAAPNFTSLLWWLLGALGTAKFLAPIFVLVAGLAAAFCARVLGFRPMVCLLVGIAAELNSNFFSNACWGVGTRGSALAAAFLAIAAIWSSRRGQTWLKLVLAGFATGMSVMEGADNGMLFSLYIAAFAFYVALIGDGSWARKIIRGVAMVTVLAVFAFFIAFVSVKSLIGTQITGKADMEQNVESKERRWAGATMWSLPKAEILRVIIPGLFGYRMDTPDGGEYWGGVGSDPQIAEIQKQLNNPDPQVQQQAANYLRQTQWRSSGAGEYAGVLVVLIAAWAFARTFSRKSQTYSSLEKKVIWFWAAMGVVGVIFAWGRFAPFYQFFYALPYMSTIRNPMKFMHPAHMTLLILFAYGLQGMVREYLSETKLARPGSSPAPAAPVVDLKWEKLWKYSTLGAVALAAVGWLLYSSTKSDLVKWMGENAIGSAAPAAEVAKFSIREAGIFALVLAISVGAVLALQSGMFRGRRALGAGVLLGLILFGDLARANAPWLQYYDYRSRYGSNPVLDHLADKRWEHRVTIAPFQGNKQLDFLQRYYQAEWLQHQFQYYNVQTLDVPNEGGRVSGEKMTYLGYVGTNIVRKWQLTNTRYILGVTGMADGLNQQLDPQRKRFRDALSFTFNQKPGTSFYVLETNQVGPFALIEFTGALPRAKVYSQWQVSTNQTSTLATLANPAFNPEAVVLVNEEIPAATVAAVDGSNTVDYLSYESKHFVQRISAATPGLLLVNDHYDPAWKVTVDGQPGKVLRCNFLMRGVQVPAGQHTVEWHYRPDLKVAGISWSAFALALLLCGVVTVITRRSAPRPA